MAVLNEKVLTEKKSTERIKSNTFQEYKINFWQSQS